eukprot:CAMPEP_0116985250 /NCGR_PEP_ID=MMETSP0467-20121206/62132_1 /TAXON_ID=283647 /ORGANISM="Mesodinium pulex, Strain SPMC105" /LENGTH=41 /DNA_ID= /DNA_START= /DNA_END= /DNA_ORIENTATION=
MEASLSSGSASFVAALPAGTAGVPPISATHVTLSRTTATSS